MAKWQCVAFVTCLMGMGCSSDVTDGDYKVVDPPSMPCGEYRSTLITIAKNAVTVTYDTYPPYASPATGVRLSGDSASFHLMFFPHPSEGGNSEQITEQYELRADGDTLRGTVNATYTGQYSGVPYSCTPTFELTATLS